MDFNPHHVSDTAEVSNRKFGLTVGAILILIGLFPSFKGSSVWLPILVPGAVLFFFGAVFPPALGPLNRFWMWLGNQLHQIVSPLLLGAVFFLVVTPVGLFRRMTHKDPLNLAFRPDLSTYWNQRAPAPDPKESLKQQF